MRRVVVAVALWPLGCVSTGADVCSNGTLCPPGLVCIEGSLSGCALPEQIDACVGLSDGDSCTVLGGEAVCESGVCLIGDCGDGQVTIGEACDDRNQVDGDGCSADCRSDESCGNGFVDIGEECDCGDSETPAEDCASLNSDDAGASCKTDCTAHCGDGEVNEAEDCDTDPVAGGCVAFGFDRGALPCNSTCAADFDMCARFGVHPAGGPGVVGAFPSGMWVSPNGTPYIVGGRTRALRVGDEWLADTEAISVAESLSYVDVHGYRDDEAFAVHNSSELLGSIRGVLTRWDGTEWTALGITGGATRAREVWAGAADDVLIAGGISVLSTPTGGVFRWDGAAITVVRTSPSEVVAIDGEGDVVAGVGGAFATFRIAGTWGAPAAVPGAVSLLSVWVASDGTTYAGGASGEMFVHDGQAWAPMASNTTEDIDALFGRTADDVFAIAGGRVLHFDGSSWMTIAGDYPTVNVGIVGPDTAFATGRHFAVSQVFDEGWRSVGDPTIQSVGICSSVPGAVFAAERDRVVHWDGTARTVVGSTFSFMAGIQALDSDRVLAYTQAGFVASTLNLYSTQAPPQQIRPLPSEPYGMAAKSVEDIGVLMPVDTDAVVEILTEGVWQPYTIALAEGERPADLVLIDGDYVALLDSGRLLRFDGTAMVPYLMTPAGSVGAVWGRDGQVFVAGDNGHMWHHDGTDWRGTTLGEQTITNIDGSAVDEVMASATEQAFYYDGVDWSPVRLAQPGLYDICVAGGEIYAAMGDRQIWRLRRTAPW